MGQILSFMLCVCYHSKKTIVKHVYEERTSNNHHSSVKIIPQNHLPLLNQLPLDPRQRLRKALLLMASLSYSTHRAEMKVDFPSSSLAAREYGLVRVSSYRSRICSFDKLGGHVRWVTYKHITQNYSLFIAEYCLHKFEVIRYIVFSSLFSLHIFSIIKYSSKQ